ncbi:DMT family transporter [Lysinibacillus pakistanensis]|uniref:EamA family transporter n=1 Tax=Lysinibacillus pakistanensis TaxID=759811 RepID=A0ABX6DG18_9BACI|nr:EamA family transporter [Lysinibacillus pakistanensis]
MTAQRKAYLAAIGYALIIGLSFMFVKVALTVASPIDTLAHRFSIAFISILIFMICTKKRVKIGKQDIMRILPLALLYPLAFFTFQVLGLAQISSTEAGIIQAAIPVFTLILASVLLKEKSSQLQLFFVSLSVAGVIFMLCMSNGGANTGNLIGRGLILLSALAVSFYNIFARKLTRQYSLISLTYMMTFCGFVIFNGVAIGNHVMNQTLPQFFKPFLYGDFVIAIVYLGILSSLVTSYLSNYSLSILEASKMSVFSNLATFITILAGVIFLKEAFHLYHLIGGVSIVIGVIGTNYFGNKRGAS